MNLAKIVKVWRNRSLYQHQLRENVVELWKSYCRRVFQTPFLAWYLFAIHKKTERQNWNRV